MSEKQQLSLHGYDENDEDYIPVPTINDEKDEESHIIHTRRLRTENPQVTFTVSSEINKTLLKSKTWKYKRNKSKKPSLQVASAHVSGSGIIRIVDTIDRPANAIAESTYAGSGVYADAFGKSGERIPKAGVYAGAGVGLARAEFSIFEAEARGPNASAIVEATVARLGAGAMAQAELGSASATAGPVGVKLGLGVDTGAYIGLGGVEFKILGTGFSFGPKTSISFLNSELSFSFL